MPRHSFGASLLAAALLGTPAARGDGGSTAPARPAPPPAPGEPFDPSMPHTQRRPNTAKLYDRLKDAKVQIPEAIGIATQATPGSVAVRATRRGGADGDTYDVGLLVGADERVVRVSTATGAIVQNTLTALSPGRREALARLRTMLAPAKVALGAAAAPALANVEGGRVLAMNAVVKGDLVRYEVAVIGPDRMASFLVDPMTGAAQPAAEESQRATEKPYVRAFDLDALGALSPEWLVAPAATADGKAAWSVVADPTAPSAPNALVFAGAGAGDAAESRCWSKLLRCQDGRITMKFRSLAPGSVPSGGLVWRAKDKDNHYVARLDVDGRTLRVEVVEGGVRKQLASAAVSPPDEGWQSIAIAHDGDRIACFLNGLKQISVNDAALPGEGGVGFFASGSAGIAFDELKVEPKRLLHTPESWESPAPPPPAPPAPPPPPSEPRLPTA